MSPAARAACMLHADGAAHEPSSAQVITPFVLGKRLLLVLESRVASPGHPRRKLQPLRGGSSEQKRSVPAANLQIQ